MLALLDLTSRPLLNGRAFGDVGAYEELTGIAEFAVDPDHPRNTPIVDLELAPRDMQGRVRFEADVRILRPVDPTRGNNGIFLDVPNRGQSIFMRMLEPGPMGPDTHITEGFLLNRGFTVVSCGWQHDVPRGEGRFGLTAPEALDRGGRIRGQLSTMRTIDAPTDVMLLDSVYEPTDIASATLVERSEPTGPETAIARDRWDFVSNTQIRYLDGFVPGKTYEVTYTAEGAAVTGVGFLALRDLVSHLRQTDGLQFALAMGASQTGRLLRQFLYLGMCEDESGKLAIDGLLPIAAGARMTEANWRFGQPSAQGPTSAVFPFTDAVQTDPATGRRDGLLRLASESGNIPKVMHMNTSSEYCASAAIVHVSCALSHLTADGQSDVAVPDNVRIYHFAGTQHAPAPLSAASSGGVYAPNTIDYKPFVRAAVDNLTRWVTQDVAPPESCYPRFDNGTLRDDLRPATDADGNEVAGLLHPDVAVPLATYTGWNPRHPDIGGEHLLLRATGATIPFSADAIAARYPSREAFLERIREAAQASIERKYLLADDLESIITTSAQRWDAAQARNAAGRLTA